MSKSAEEFVLSWARMTQKEVGEWLVALGDEGKQEPKKERVVRQWAIRNEVRPSDLFFYLGARFGPPNGFQNFLRGDHSDNLIHWEWSVRCGAAVVNIQGHNFRSEMWAVGPEPGLDGIAADSIAVAINTDLKNYAGGMATVRDAMEHWVEFVNPYQRIRRSLSQLLDTLRDLKLPGAEISPDQLAHQGLDPRPAIERWNEVGKHYSFGFGLCFGVRSMLPVLAESFVNVLMYVLMRPEIKNDKRLRENAFRQAIDVRIKSLSINCLGFERPVDYTVEACAKYHSLVNERNDLLHGNVAIEKLKFNELYFWGKVPVFKEYQSMWDRSMGVDARATGWANIEKEVVVVEDFIAYVKSCLEPSYRKNVEIMLSKTQLGLNQENGRMGVLFGDRLAFGIMGYEWSDPSRGGQKEAQT